MDYREYPVPPALAALVEAFWTLEDSSGAAMGARADQESPGRTARSDSEAPGPPPGPEPVIPDGRAELIVHFGDPFERFDDGSPTLQADTLVAGQLDAPLLLRPTGAVATLGVRMTPVGAWALLGIPQGELVGTTHAVGDLSRPLERLLAEARERGGTPARAVSWIAEGLLPLARPDVVDARVARAVRRLDRDDAPESVASLGAELGFTSRHLQRLFRTQVGLSPRTYGRIRRFQRAMALIEVRGGGGGVQGASDGGGPSVSGSAVAHRAGYADQSHFIREFRALAGTTPSGHAVARAELTGVFLTGRGG